MLVVLAYSRGKPAPTEVIWPVSIRCDLPEYQALYKQLCIAVTVGAGLPAIGCEAVVKSVSAQCQTGCGYRVYDCFAADRRQASSYRGFA